MREDKSRILTILYFTERLGRGILLDAETSPKTQVSCCFCPKYRYHILQDDIAGYTRQQVYQLCRQKDAMEVLELTVPFVTLIRGELAQLNMESDITGHRFGSDDFSPVEDIVRLTTGKREGI